jgi:hypothetical protein
MNNLTDDLFTKLRWLPGLSALAAFVACKGSIILIALFPLLGFTLSINASVQAVAISSFALLTPTLAFCNYRRFQTSRMPVMLSLIAALMVVGTMYIYFNVIVESLGLVILLVSALWSWSAAKPPVKAVSAA